MFSKQNYRELSIRDRIKGFLIIVKLTIIFVVLDKFKG